MCASRHPFRAFFGPEGERLTLIDGQDPALD